MKTVTIDLKHPSVTTSQLDYFPDENYLIDVSVMEYKDTYVMPSRTSSMLDYLRKKYKK